MGGEVHASPPATPAMQPAVALRGITKRFPGVVANDHVDFEAAEGEVHALLGENGAGKTTLSNILTGLYRADEGEIVLFGEPREFHSPRDALDAGIAMVHQHFRLVSPFTVAENVVLGDHRDIGRTFLLHTRAIEQKVAELSRRYGLAVDPRAKIWQLSLGEQQRVEILKTLYQDARILILDEPTAVLTPQEADALFETIRALADDGRTVIFISHKLHEVKVVADRVRSRVRAGGPAGHGGGARAQRREQRRLEVLSQAACVFRSALARAQGSGAGGVGDAALRRARGGARCAGVAAFGWKPAEGRARAGVHRSSRPARRRLSDARPRRRRDRDRA